MTQNVCHLPTGPNGRRPLCVRRTVLSARLQSVWQNACSVHPMGGTAYLSLESPDEPFLHGVKFTAMPPTKRFRDMEQLSGGEKVMSPQGHSHPQVLAMLPTCNLLACLASCMPADPLQNTPTPDHNTCKGCEHAPGVAQQTYAG